VIVERFTELIALNRVVCGNGVENQHNMLRRRKAEACIGVEIDLTVRTLV
jgi:hypothetical protein